MRLSILDTSPPDLELWGPRVNTPIAWAADSDDDQSVVDLQIRPTPPVSPIESCLTSGGLLSPPASELFFKRARGNHQSETSDRKADATPRPVSRPTASLTEGFDRTATVLSGSQSTAGHSCPENPADDALSLAARRNSGTSLSAHGHPQKTRSARSPAISRSPSAWPGDDPRSSPKTKTGSRFNTWFDNHWPFKKFDSHEYVPVSAELSKRPPPDLSLNGLCRSTRNLITSLRPTTWDHVESGIDITHGRYSTQMRFADGLRALIK